MNSDRAFSSRISSVVASATLVAWITSHSCLAQSPDRSNAGFGPLIDVRLPERSDHITDLRREGDHDRSGLLAWSTQSSNAALIEIASLHEPALIRTLVLPTKPLFLFLAPLNTNGERKIVLISSSSIATLEESDGHSIAAIGSTAIPFVPSAYCIADLNNDGKTDIALTTKSEPGILPMYGNGKGRFRAGKTIVPDAAVGPMAAVYLNNDFLVDLVVYDWLKSELHALYGVGRGRFLDQSTFPVVGNVTGIESFPAKDRGVADLVLTTADPSTVQVWNVNELGDFKSRTPVAFARTSTLRILERNGSANILSSDEQGMQLVDVQEPENGESVGGTHACTDATAITMPDGARGLAFLNASGDSVTVVGTIGDAVALRDSLVLATGSGPAGVLVADADRNGRNDIIVTNTGAASVSIFSAEANGGIRSHTQIALDTTAEDVFALQSNDTSARLLFGNSRAGIVASSLLHVRDRITESNIISTPAGAAIVYASRRSATVEFGTELRSTATPTLAYSYYRQLNESQFLEETFRLPEPYILTGGVFGDVDRDGYRDFLALFHHPDSTTLEIAATFGDSALTMKQVGEAHETGLPAAASMMVWLADINADDTLDLLCLVPERDGALYVLLGTAEKSFSPALKIASGVTADSREEIVVVDCNSDKYPDVVFRDRASGRLRWWMNTSKARSTPISSLKDVEIAAVQGRFSLGDLNGDGIPEIAVTDRYRGRLIVYNGKRHFK